MQPLGRTRWAIPEGYLPRDSEAKPRTLRSHETACLLNTGDIPAAIRLTVYFADREPVGPFEFTVEARRTKHLRFDELEDPATIPRETDFSSVIESSVPVVVQHSRLDARAAVAGLITTIAYAE
jgi:hypothetical protein